MADPSNTDPTSPVSTPNTAATPSVWFDAKGYQHFYNTEQPPTAPLTPATNADQTSQDAAASDAARRQPGGDLASTQPTAPAPPPSPVPPKPIPATAQQVPTSQATGFADPGKGTDTRPTGRTGDEQSLGFNQDKIPYDPRWYEGFVRAGDDRLKAINDAANTVGVSPSRLALHSGLEGSGRTVVPPSVDARGNIIAVGPFQMKPDTMREVDPKGQFLGPDGTYNNISFKDQAILAARYIKILDGQFGRDSTASVAAYHSGPAIVDQLAHAKGQPGLDFQHPALRDYMNKAYPGQNIALDSFTPRSTMSGDGLVAAGTRYGPEGTARWISFAKSPGLGPTDAWRQAEASLVQAAMSRGDIAGAIHAHDWIFQMSHAGTNQFLMQAHQLMQAGDSWGAAQALAKASTFFPDDTMGRFYVDSDGTIWGQRMDEHHPNDPNAAIGKPFKVTADGIESMLMQTTDPNNYLKMVYAQRSNAADIRYKNAQAYYETQRPDLEREKILGDIEASRERGAAAAEERAQQQQNKGLTPAQQQAAQSKAATEASKLYGPDANDVPGMSALSSMTPEDRGLRTEMAADLIRDNKVTPMQARVITDQIRTGKLGVRKREDGVYAVIGPNGAQTGYYLSDRTGAQLDAEEAAAKGKGKGDEKKAAPSPVDVSQSSAIPRGGPSGSPVGAGAASPMAAMMGAMSGGLAYPQQPGVQMGTTPAGVQPAMTPPLAP